MWYAWNHASLLVAKHLLHACPGTKIAETGINATVLAYKRKI